MRVVLTLALVISAAHTLSACVKYETTKERTLREIQEQNAPYMVEGWLVRCNDQKATNSSTCSASKWFPQCDGCFGTPFFIDDFLTLLPSGLVRQTRKITPGRHTETWEKPTVRVDNNAPISDMSSSTLMWQLRSGKRAYAKYYEWPYGPDTMEANLTGLSAALTRLDEISAKKTQELISSSPRR